MIAAYRDQHKVTTDDPRQVLGPYAEPGHAGHKAYWHAAESVLRRPPARRARARQRHLADGRASAQLAADIYRSLPGDERAAIAELVATTPGIIWLGDPARPDEHAAAQPAYARHLGSVLARRGHAPGGLAFLPDRQQAEEAEPTEAALARRGRPGQATGKHARGAGTGAVTGSQESRLVQVPPQSYCPPNGPSPAL